MKIAQLLRARLPMLNPEAVGCSRVAFGGEAALAIGAQAALIAGKGAPDLAPLGRAEA
jgi:hypothetical protein